MANRRWLIFLGSFLAGYIVWQYKIVNSSTSSWYTANQRPFRDIRFIATVAEPRLDVQDNILEKRSQYIRKEFFNDTRSAIRKTGNSDVMDIDESGTVTEESSLLYRIYMDYRKNPALVHIIMFRKCAERPPSSIDIILHRLRETNVSIQSFELKSDCFKRFDFLCDWREHDAYFKIPTNLSLNTTFTGTLRVFKILNEYFQ